jgi:hypothetical protein
MDQCTIDREAACLAAFLQYDEQGAMIGTDCNAAELTCQ